MVVMLQLLYCLGEFHQARPQSDKAQNLGKDPQ